MTTYQYRALLIASLIVGLIGGGLDLMFPQLLPETFREVQAAHDNALSIESLLMFAGLGIVAVILLFVSIYGLFRFRPWAPRLSAIATALSLFCLPFSGAFAQSGLAISISYLASYLWGAAVVLPFVQPLNKAFSRHEG